MKVHSSFVCTMYSLHAILHVYLRELVVVVVVVLVVVHADRVRLCLSTVATNGRVVCPQIYEYGELRWEDIDRVNRRTRRKTCISATLSNHKTHMD
jgi:hypothetical protein